MSVPAYPAPTQSRRRTFAVVLAGMLLVQLAWIAVLPAFHGIDEFDHAYKADAVAHGQLGHDGAPDEGRGGLLRVSPDIVEAASAKCSAYSYTGPDNCNAVTELPNGLVTVASGAATYNPAYYAVVGTLALPFEGVTALLVMRVLTALLAALLVAWAAVVTTSWARNRWPLVCLGLAVTPVLVYSSTITSPNGVGYAAAVLLWTSAIALLEGARPPLPALTTAATVMLVTHTTGGLWLAVIMAVLFVLQPWSAWRATLGRHRVGFALSGTTIALVGVACLAWILLARTNALSPADESLPPLRVGALLAQVPVWVFQTVAAFPLRDQPAPLPVYALWLGAFAVVMTFAVRRTGRRVRVALLLLLVAWLAIPLALTVVAFPSEGFAWQGRYALALAVGFPAVAALVLNRRRGPGPVVTALAFLVFALAHAMSVAYVGSEFGRSPHAPTFAEHLPAGFALATVLALLGGLLPALLATRTPTPWMAQSAQRSSRDHPCVPEEAR